MTSFHSKVVKYLSGSDTSNSGIYREHFLTTKRRRKAELIGLGLRAGIFLPDAFSLRCGLAFGATAHVDVHGAAPDAFMTLPAYTRTREGEVHPLGNGPEPCRRGLGVRKGSPTFDS